MAPKENERPAGRYAHGPSKIDQLCGDRQEDSNGVSVLPLEIRRIQKNAKEQLRISLEDFRGHKLVDVRIWEPFTAAEVYTRTKKGVSVRLDLIPSLTDALNDAYERARELGLVGGDGA